jgi:HSP20 family molecular chaperone IbpA
MKHFFDDNFLIDMPTLKVSTDLAADYKNGILKIVMPKKIAQNSGRIKINVTK